MNIRTRPQGQGPSSTITRQLLHPPGTGRPAHGDEARPPLRAAGANTKKHQPPALMWGPGPGAQTLTTGKGWQSRRKSCRRAFFLTSPGNCTSPQNLRGPHTPVSDPGRPTPSLPGGRRGPPDLRAVSRREAAQVQHPLSLCRWGHPYLHCQGIESCSMTRLPDPMPTDLSRRLAQGWAGCGRAPLLRQEHGRIRTNIPNPVLSAAGPASPLPALSSLELTPRCWTAVSERLWIS